MKEVLISIKPKWCELIANGKKTIEVRKTRPKIETPFKCYIYCTNSKPLIGVYKNKLLQLEEDDFDFYNKDVLYKSNGKVIGEFVCDDVSKFTAEFTDDNCYEDIRYHYFDAEQEEQEMIVVSNEWENYNDCWIFRRSCVSFDDLKKYIGINFHDIPFYFWHISDLKIYDKPKELSDFCIVDKDAVKNCKKRFRFGQPEDKCKNGGWIKGSLGCMDYEPDWCSQCKKKALTKPPQSWCYAEKTEG